MRLTLNEDYDVGSPSARCHRYNDLLPIPNGDAGVDCNYLIWSDCRIEGRTCGARSREKQRQRLNTQRSNKCRTFIPSSEIGSIGGAAHKLKEVLELRIAAYQGEVHMKQMENTRTSQLYGVVTSMPIKHIMIAIRVAMRVVK